MELDRQRNPRQGGRCLRGALFLFSGAGSPRIAMLPVFSQILAFFSVVKITETQFLIDEYEYGLISRSGTWYRNHSFSLRFGQEANLQSGRRQTPCCCCCSWLRLLSHLSAAAAGTRQALIEAFRSLSSSCASHSSTFAHHHPSFPAVSQLTLLIATSS